MLLFMRRNIFGYSVFCTAVRHHIPAGALTTFLFCMATLCTHSCPVVNSLQTVPEYQIKERRKKTGNKVNTSRRRRLHLDADCCPLQEAELQLGFFTLFVGIFLKEPVSDESLGRSLNGADHLWGAEDSFLMQHQCRSTTTQTAWGGKTKGEACFPTSHTLDYIQSLMISKLAAKKGHVL